MSIRAVQFVVEGEPKATQRPRVMQRKGKGGKMFPVAIKAAADTEAQERVRQAFLKAMEGKPWPLEDDRAYAVRAIFLRGTFRKADLDNLLKTVLDGLNGTAFGDDSQVHLIQASVDYAARHGKRPGSTIVQVRRLPQDLQGMALPLESPPPTED